MNDRPSEVILILDPNYGERIGQLTPGIPAWVVRSAANAPALDKWWADHPECNNLSGITGFYEREGITSPESRFTVQLDNIEQHHGPYSTDSPHTRLRVIGLRLTEQVRHELSALGFTMFAEDAADGFTASRTLEEARKIRL
jgi:hypothetical protein